MKTYNILKLSALFSIILLNSCEPNKELYKELDALREPLNKKVVYTLTQADYNSFGSGAVATAIKNLQSFNDTISSKDYIPTVLAKKFLALNLGSSANVTFNFSHSDANRSWENIAVGYQLTNTDYNNMAGYPPYGNFVASLKYFMSTAIAKDYLPKYLKETLYPTAPVGSIKTIRYKYYISEGNIPTYADFYKLTRISTTPIVDQWVHVKTLVVFSAPDHIITPADYSSFGFTSNIFPNAAEADRIINIWLKNRFPYAAFGIQKSVYYEYMTTIPMERASQYTFNGENWVRSSGIEVRTEQYVYGANGWVFDPTVRFIMSKADYTIIAVNDPTPHPRFADQGMYFGASGFYGNFDMRVNGFHLLTITWEGKTYDPAIDDPELVAIVAAGGEAAGTAELYRRILKEGIIILLQKKFPNAVPQVDGIDVHYIVGFETYSPARAYPEAEYRCTAAASGDTPPQFEFIEGPRPRQ
jgi:hypothetical protein